MTNEQIEQKKQQLAEQELSTEHLDQATGGKVEGWRKPTFMDKEEEEEIDIFSLNLLDD